LQEIKKCDATFHWFQPCVQQEHDIKVDILGDFGSAILSLTPRLLRGFTHALPLHPNYRFQFIKRAAASHQMNDTLALEVSWRYTPVPRFRVIRDTRTFIATTARL
jgi:hypothetical protein